MVNLVRHDLEFILKQIKIAEAHSAGTPLNQIRVDAQGNLLKPTDPDYASAVPAIPSQLSPYGLRTVDGSYNNLVAGREEWGAADQPFLHVTDPYWRNEGDDQHVVAVIDTNNDGTPDTPITIGNNNYGQPGSVADADPRIISNLIVDQTLDNPAAIYAALVYAGAPAAELLTTVNDIRAAKTEVDTAIQLAEDQGNDVDTDAAVIAARSALTTLLNEHGVVVEGNSVVIPNVSPDVGLSAQYNGWFTLFGQFFDHGLDLVPKGGNGTIYIPLQPDDPLYDPEHPETNFMVLTRAPANPVNLTTPFVDQNQTYSSNASKQLFMREYEFSVDSDSDGEMDSHPISTGRLLSGERGLATWADVKKQAAEKLGINLTDADVANIPLFVMDEYGEFVRGERGLPQMVTSLGLDGKFGGGDDTFVEGDLTSPISTANAIRTGHAFLDDIAHSAAPGLVDHDRNPATQRIATIADDDDVAGNNIPVNEFGVATTYDNELLDAHYVTGDGRGNENIGLSAVHHVFHSEHNHMVEQVKVRAIESGDLDFLNEWLRVDLPAGTVLPPANDAAAIEAFAKTLAWDGERLFQAARFTTEMQYQHLVFEEFARKVQPDVDAFVFQPSMDINPAIFAEFAHVVYRFGHSMLRETVDRDYGDGTNGDLDLFDAFLNPLAFGGVQRDENGNPILDKNGNQIVLNHDAAAGAIVRGMSNQIGNEIDEFVTDVLRNQLLGIPLDLAALNIARGRDTGIPSLNEARRQFKEIANGDSQLDPYTSWKDFGLNLKNPASIVNFIAAYGTHESLIGTVEEPLNLTLQEKRDAAWKLVFGDPTLSGAELEEFNADRLAFLNAKGKYAGGKLGGLEDVDLWVGGMAEKKMDFGGMLGSTFSFIFELQLENLQNGDRFYYLSRVQGLNFLNELENNSFAKMVLNNTDLGEKGYAVAGDIFSTPDHILYMDHAQQKRFGYKDPVQEDAWQQAVSPMIERRDASGNLINPEDNPTAVARYIRVNTNDHVLVQGTDAAETIIAGGGDDSVWGRGGNDRIEAGYGVDKIHGGTGDDIITNSGTDIGEVDFFHGEEGNDVIHGGSGLALLFGNQGNDVLITGPDGKEAFGGTGDDFILGGDGGDFLLGNEGDDWIEGGNGFDTIAGDNSELNFNSTIIGHDVMFAGENEQDFDAESGDDIMVQGESVMRNEGMWGFDWAIHKGNKEAADSDLTRPIFTTDEQDILRDRFDQVEALSGWEKNDVLRGDDRGDPDPNAEPEIGENPNLAGAEGTMVKHELTQAGVNRIEGLRELLGDLIVAPTAGNLETQIAFDDGNILLGGGGADLIEGRGGNDLIDGDSWLNVRIRFTHENVIYTTDGLSQKIYREADYAGGAPRANAVAAFGGKALDVLMVNGTLNPGRLSIVREIVKDDGVGDDDIAAYGDVRANYTFTQSNDGSVRISHDTVSAGLVSDGIDRLRNIEMLRFADQDLYLVQKAATGQPVISDLTPTEGEPLTVDVSGIQDLNGLGTFSYQWQSSANGTTWTNIAGATGATFTPDDDLFTAFGDQAGRQLRVIVRFTDGLGNAEELISDATGPVGVNWNAVISSTFNGTAGDDIANGSLFGDTLRGNAGDDRLNGNGGNDVITGGAGDDLIDGGGNSIFGGGDTAVFTGAVRNYSVGTVGNTITVTDNVGSEGTDILSSIEVLRFNGVDYGVVSGSNGNNNNLNGPNGANGSQAVFGLGGNDAINGGAGDDLIDGGDGDDTITQTGSTGGRDLVDGGAGTDTYRLNGVVGAETFRIYTRAAWAAAGNSLDGLNADTEIVITRNGTTNAQVIAELDNIEEIVINSQTASPPGGPVDTSLGGDTIRVFGDFGETSLNLNTITIDGDGGDDTVDISELESDHRIVFRSNGGHDTILGTLRQQDVIELPRGTVDFTSADDENGTTTLSYGENTITYAHGEEAPTVQESTASPIPDQPDEPDPDGRPTLHLTVRENSPAGTVVLDLATFDADLVSAYAISLEASTLFELVDNKIVVKEGALLDYEALQEHSLELTATKGDETLTALLVIAVEDVDETPGGDPDENQAPVVNPDSFTVKKGEVLNLTVADLLANDSDPDGDTLTITGVDEDEHGTVVLHPNGTLTFTPKDGFTGPASFTYTVSDGQGGHATGTVSITVKPADTGGGQPGGGGGGGGGPVPGGHAPTDILLTGGTVKENAKAGTLVGTLAAVDPDAGDSFTYTLAGPASALFALDGNQIKVKHGAVLDYEQARSHELTVTVTDKAGLSYSEAVTIQVQDEAEGSPAQPPVWQALASAFDGAAYLAANPDVAAAGMDPLEHYVRYGAAEGRAAPGLELAHVVGRQIIEGVDCDFYLLNNPDVAQAGMDAVFHFQTYGWKEGRDANAFFDAAFYLAHNPDVAQAGLGALDHYLRYGASEGRDPSAWFDSEFYLAANRDVAEAGMNPLEHFLRYGLAEGRVCQPEQAEHSAPMAAALVLDEATLRDHDSLL